MDMGTRVAHKRLCLCKIDCYHQCGVATRFSYHHQHQQLPTFGVGKFPTNSPGTQPSPPVLIDLLPCSYVSHLISASRYKVHICTDNVPLSVHIILDAVGYIEVLPYNVCSNIVSSYSSSSSYIQICGGTDAALLVGRLWIKIFLFPFSLIEWPCVGAKNKLETFERPEGQAPQRLFSFRIKWYTNEATNCS